MSEKRAPARLGGDDAGRSSGGMLAGDADRTLNNTSYGTSCQAVEPTPAWRRRWRPISELSNEELQAAKTETRGLVELADAVRVYNVERLRRILELAAEIAA